jgi:dephospho-CoA kinase
MLNIVGLSGGIACGKSSVAEILRAAGHPVIDADQLAREVVARGQPALSQIVATFGDTVLCEDGELDRRQLGELVFADPDARKQLESITHPAIALASREAFIELSNSGHELAFYEAALLVETGGYKSMAALVVVTAQATVQRQRLQARDVDLSHEQIEKRIASQMPMAEKEAVADYVIRNDGSPDELEARTMEILEQIRSRFNG